MARRRPTVAMVVETPPTNSPFLLYKFQQLLGLGWHIDLVCLAPAVRSDVGLATMSDHAKRHMRLAWPTRSRLSAAMLFPVALAACLAQNPGGTLRYLRRAWSRFGADTFRRFYLDATIVATRADVVHFEFGALAVGRMHLRELLGCAIVVSFRGYDINYIGLDTDEYYQGVWKRADAIHLLGEDLWRRAMNRGCPADKPHVLIPPAVDLEFFSPVAGRDLATAGTPARPFRIVSVGRLAWKKGYDYALQAVRLLRDRGLACEYRIIGEGDYFEALAFARHQLGLEAIVAFAGAQPPAAVKDELARADVFLHAAVSEGFCNAVIEAQAMGLPVVSSDADGLAENVLDGETGFVVSRRDAKALADRLELLATHAALRGTLGANARRRAVERFALADQISAFEDLYRRVSGTAAAAQATADCG